ncbi:nuclear transport factor 2B-like [Zingiber officinale]|uniref:nuclear transport factor 2B-like n=1 Tax=Zingiber officinale TaxID=94328 RepID=UPI001C4D6391|nr:nuclear transport factor 2B-like [Zingiber officinale]
MARCVIFNDFRVLFNAFASNPHALGGLYLDYSMLTIIEGENIQGAAAIAAKLTSHPFQLCAHAISTVDSQPLGHPGGVLVFVSGSLQLGGEQHPHKFSQVSRFLPVCGF